MNVQEQTAELARRAERVAGATRTDDGRYVATSGWDANEVVGRDGLATQNDQISLWLNGEPAWHSLGQVGEWKSIQDTLEQSGLDWDVETRPMFFGATKESVYASDKVDVGQMFATVRVDPNGTETQLGTVGRIYTPFQNREAFSLLQEIAEQDGNTISTAGMLSLGSLVFVTMELGEDLIIDPQGARDAIKKYLTFTNRHDGKGKIRVHVSPTRVVCRNTLDWSIEGATASWEALHTAKSRGKVEEARRDLHLANAYYDKFAADATALFEAPMTNQQFDDFISNVVFPLNDSDPKRVVDRVTKERDDVRALYRSGPATEGVRGTRWGAAQAVTEYWDNHSAVRVPRSLRIDTALPQSVREEMARGARVVSELDSGKKSEVHRALLTWKR